jgi:hypothetical protein
MNVILPSSPPAPTSDELKAQQAVIAEMHGKLQENLKKAAAAEGRLALIESREAALADQERLLAYRLEICERREKAVAVAAAEHQLFAESLQRRASELGSHIADHAARLAAQTPKE